MDDFDNLEKHEEFISSCEAVEALGFAMSKYQEIKAAQGGDLFSERMIASIHARISTQLHVQLKKVKNRPLFEIKKNITPKPRWQKYAIWAPYSFSIILILWGAFSLGHRNLIGLGVAIAFLASGLITMLKGSLRLQDFID